MRPRDSTASCSSLLFLRQHGCGEHLQQRAPAMFLTLQVVSDAFAGKPLIARHRLIYAALSEELQAGLHALQLTTKTPAEAGR